MYRAQILLDPNQHRRLEELARREGRSISAVTRQVIDAGLRCLGTEAETWNKRSQILANARAKRDQQAVQYPGDLINEVRQERDEENDNLWHAQS